ncbi:hypothetical protein LJC60_09850 [Ruminococcaceae bacterium OttesenSCG-928-D13]|nr:hypothetical protein [Ruminococcaceae bacterium OttesenSCG-928-D13]
MMVAESIAILLVGLLLIGSFARSKHPGYMLGALPVCIIPAAHLIIIGVLAISKQRFFGIRPAMVTAFADVVAVILSCLFIVIFSQRIQSKKNRNLYMVIMLVYTLLIGWSYIYTTVSPLFA